MKKLLLCAAAMTLLFTACKKNDDDNPVTGLGKNQWKINGNTYTAAGVSGIAGILSATATNANGTDQSSVIINFEATTFPTTGGTYKIVDIADAADEIDLTVTRTISGTTSAWDSKATGNPTATVAVDAAGKITVTIPELTLAPSPGTGTTGDATFSGSVTQN
jgi:hypothetical protein